MVTNTGSPGPNGSSAPRLLDRVRDALLLRHYSVKTVEAYLGWTRRFILFHGKRHPSTLGAAEVSAFLSALATQNGVSASTQNQALAALVAPSTRAQPASGAGSGCFQPPEPIFMSRPGSDADITFTRRSCSEQCAPQWQLATSTS